MSCVCANYGLSNLKRSGVLKEISHTEIHCRRCRRYAGIGAVPSLLALLSVFLAGCANTCFVVVSNPPTGTIGVVAGNPPPACALAKANAAVRLVVHVNRLCEFCSESNQIQSVLLSLRGIDIFIRKRTRRAIRQSGRNSFRNQKDSRSRSICKTKA